jgi:hypothetical protein
MKCMLRLEQNLLQDSYGDNVGSHSPASSGGSEATHKLEICPSKCRLDWTYHLICIMYAALINLWLLFHHYSWPTRAE